MAPRPLSPELRLVFRSADPSVAPDEMRALAGEVRDWGRALQLAEREGATSAIWAAFRQDHSALPGEAVMFLRSRTMMSDFRMARLSERLAETLAVFRDREIPVMLLKGAAVGAMADPSFRARPMTDVDLLVHKEDAARAREAVLAARWTQSSDERLHELLKEMHHEAPFHDAQLPGLRLELHTVLLPPDHAFALSLEELWNAALHVQAPFQGASIPSPAHLLFHVAVHFAWQHQMQFGTWRSLRAAGVVVQAASFDWQQAIALAMRTRAATSLYWTLRLAQRLAAMEIPSEALVTLAPPTGERWRQVIERSVVAGIAPGESPQNPSDRLSRLLWRAALRPKWSGLGDAGRHDPDQTWARTMGTYRNEGPLAKLGRHARSSRDWWAFVTRTLGGR